MIANAEHLRHFTNESSLLPPGSGFEDFFAENVMGWKAHSLNFVSFSLLSDSRGYGHCYDTSQYMVR